MEKDRIEEQLFMNRELSWLKFNERVLEEAEDESVPLCERLSFAAIYQSNLDEFFMVRVGSLEDQMLLGKKIRDNKTHMTPAEQIDGILKKVRKLSSRRDRAYQELMKSLEPHGVRLTDFGKLGEEEKDNLSKFFRLEIEPLISPTVIGKRQPFPFLRNKEIYAVAVLATKSGKERLGIIPCTNNMVERLIPVLGQDGCYMLSEELILHYMPRVFSGYQIRAKSLIRVTRNADIDADALYDEDLDYREFMADLIRRRKKLSPVRLELSREMDGDVVETLCKYLDLDATHVFRSQTPLDLSFVFQIQDILRKKADLFYEKRVPQKSPSFREGRSIIEQIKEEDKMLSYPYESIRPFLRLLNEAAEDDNVISIKMTLYRLAKQSKVVEALVEGCREREGSRGPRGTAGQV